jgi:hypothetical protein
MKISQDNRIKRRIVFTPPIAWAILFVFAFSPGYVFARTEFEHQVVDAEGGKLGNPHCKGIGDIDGDGSADLVVGYSRGSGLYWYKSPSWERHQIQNGDSFSTDMKVGDVDGDGDNDVIIPKGTDKGGDVYWYENPRLSGDINGIWPEHHIGEAPAHDVAIGDMNGDGKLDVVSRMGTAHLFLQGSTPDDWQHSQIGNVFTEGTDIGDIDKDGDLDVAVTNVWLENPGWEQHTYGSVPKETGVTLADVNGDGNLDIVTTGAEADGGSRGNGDVYWFNANGNPKGEWQRNLVDTNVFRAHTFKAGDMDNDGDIDLVIGEMYQSDTRRVMVYYNNGNATEWDRQVLSTNGIHNLRIGDIGGDGDLDIFGVNWKNTQNGSPVEAWINTLDPSGGSDGESGSEKSSLDKWTYINVDNNRNTGKAFGLGLGDATGDGMSDIVSGKYFYRNPGGDMTGKWTRSELPESADAFLITNVDDDEFGDIFAMKLKDAQSVYWMEATDANGGAWQIQETVTGIATPGHDNAQGYNIAQIISGGKPEVLISAAAGVTMIEMGTWNTTVIAPDASEEGIGVADFDGDGNQDISVHMKTGKQVSWFKNPGTGGGNWQGNKVGTVDKEGDRMAAGDINGDGQPDIIVTEETPSDGASTYWFENGSWQRHTIVTQATTNSLDVFDMDGDGDLDVITGEHRGGKKVSIWENDGTGNFTEHEVDTGKESHLGARVADLNGDGKSEIVSIGYDDAQNLHLWRNDNAGGEDGTRSPGACHRITDAGTMPQVERK